MRWAVFLLLAVVTAPIFIVLAAYIRWWWAGGRGPDNEPLPLGWRVAGLAQEVVALTLTVGRLMRRRRTVPRTAAQAPDIVLIVGGALSEAALAPLIHRLDASGWTMALFRPSPGRTPVAEAAAQLDAFVRSHAQRTGTVLIAYGSAGLILRYYLRRYPAAGIRRVVTIGTPHQGTEAPLAGLGATRQPPAATLRQLATGDRVPHQFDVIAISSDLDEFIAPASRAYYPGAFNIQVRGVGHFALPRSLRLFELLSENLGSPAARGSVPHQAR